MMPLRTDLHFELGNVFRDIFPLHRGIFPLYRNPGKRVFQPRKRVPEPGKRVSPHRETRTRTEETWFCIPGSANRDTGNVFLTVEMVFPIPGTVFHVAVT